jgi:hypothetical protein
MPISLSIEHLYVRQGIALRATRGIPLVLSVVLMLLNGCGNPPRPAAPNAGSLNTGNVNLVFVISEDLDYNASGDIDANTANLTSQGLQRSLIMASFLKKSVLGNHNVNNIYALEPMTHLQTTDNYPDMAALETIQQFAMLNEDTLQFNPVGTALYTARSFHINASYAPGQTIGGVASPLISCEGCQGIDYANQGSDNDSLLSNLVKEKVPGYYVFSAPWETTLDMIAVLNQTNGYSLLLPSSYPGPNNIYAITITPSGSASLVVYDSDVKPLKTYPVLTPEPSVSTPCQAKPFNYVAPSAHPPLANTNEVLYLIRHAEAHPVPSWENGNYVAQGQWRSLALPFALQGKISPDQVYSIDPAQATPSGYFDWSYVRPSVTVQPYAIANHLPYHLVAGFELIDESTITRNTIDFFFNDPQFSNHKILLAWEHEHFPPLVNALLKSYSSSQTAPAWASGDYDSIWTIRLDSAGNLTVDNSICEGIDSAKLPETAPQF